MTTRKTRTKTILTSTIVPLLLLNLMVPITSAEPSDTEVLPGPDLISQTIDADCGRLLRSAVEAPAADPVPRLDYAACAVSSFRETGLLQPIGDHCRGNDAYQDKKDLVCASDLIDEQDIGPQVSALIEACFLLGHYGTGACDPQFIFEDLGSDLRTNTAQVCPGVMIKAGAQQFKAESGKRCQAFGTVGDDLCDQGICLDDLIGVSHQDEDFGDPDCSGVKIKTEVTAGGSGHIVNLGIYIWWSAKARASVQTSIEWNAACEADVELRGFAWGGFMRQLSIERDDQKARICSYDGFVRWDCGDLAGEAWSEHVVATAEGAYDHDEQAGEKPPNVMTVFARPDGQWKNEFQGSLNAIKLFDAEAAVLEGSQDVVVDYEEQDFRILGDVLGLLDDPGSDADAALQTPPATCLDDSFWDCDSLGLVGEVDRLRENLENDVERERRGVILQPLPAST